MIETKTSMVRKSTYRWIAIEPMLFDLCYYSILYTQDYMKTVSMIDRLC